ncbi:MAG: dTDP-4-dehydrorhamnose 3,5-epimerase [Candidatus Adiutrix sp.]|jgi:dTDP-4-dehydrorhamnose 3,5-epimerase|nr:dTDP-4-dehydrorhamnose 3,5-epimerase [Candidatus Adiutrix sp.]
MIRRDIPGLKLLEGRRFFDQRGHFQETFRLDTLERELGRPFNIVQDNESLSKAPGIIRGLHFQRPPYAQAKLVRVVSGAIWDVALDLRPDSPSFGRWEGVLLSADNNRQLFLPAGLAHGFCTLAENTVVQYKVDNYYAPDSEGGLRWDDPELNIDWSLSGRRATVSDKDAAWPLWSQLDRIKW